MIRRIANHLPHLLALAFALLVASPHTQAQSTFGPSDPSPKVDGGEYQWPEVQSPCPEVQIKQKHDHTAKKEYRDQGWDTAVTCATRQITISCMPYIPVQFFNGQYYVDTIPFDPPDTTFYMSGQGTKMNIQSDDVFAPSAVTLGFPFYFFGYKKTQFRLGDNGMVTFCSNSDYSSDASSNYCAYQFSTGLPWSDDKTGWPSNYPNRMRDAIYGVYEDSHPLPNTVTGTQGIYYGVIDSFPCRKIIATWNEIPLFSSQINNRETYQIVCYEGTNIIEVHVKRRGCCSNTNDGIGIIGIQNADGELQTKGTGTAKNVITGSPSAFYTGLNGGKQTLNNIAFRFTPAGTTPKNYEWYRIFDDGSDSILLTQDPSDTNGYYTSMGSVKGDDAPTLTTAVVHPTRTSRYVFHLKFMNANMDWYDLYDTITVGVDTLNDMYLHAAGAPKQQDVFSICAGRDTTIVYEIPAVQVPVDTTVTVYRISNGVQIPLPLDSCITIGGMQLDNITNTKRWNIAVKHNMPTIGQRANKVDSIYFQISSSFESGCSNYTTLLMKVFPNFDTTETFVICDGQNIVWSADNKTYTESTRTTKYLKSEPGCDSTVHLDLTVLDVSFTRDVINDCKPITWLNGKTYTETNSATYGIDTLRLRNQWDCDSIVQLDFTLTPVVAQIQSNRNAFDFDNLTVQLNDISTGSNNRTWLLPDGGASTSSIVHYTISPSSDEADIRLIAYSPYGCADTARLVIPMRKETFWMPNVFMPDNDQGVNTTFGSISVKTLTQEMFIYNRMGELVFQCDEPDCQWDGRDSNGTPCVQGTYVYFVRYTNEFEPERVHVLRGTVTLIR